MRFCTYQVGSKTNAGIVQGKTVFNLAQCFFRTYKRPFVFRDLLAFLEADGPERMEKIDFPSLAGDKRCAHKLREVKLRAPVLRPPKIVCVGLNYRGHAEEQNLPLPERPLLFAKAPNATIGTGDEIVIPRWASEKIDYEVELAAVIAKPGHRIPKEKALDHVFGCTVFNDVTARDIQKGDKQWFRGKSFATFAPSGPFVVTLDELDVAGLPLTLRLNGKVMQEGNTSDLIHDLPSILEFASDCFPLEAGDLVATGTPSGVGVFRDPQVWLRPGDRVEAEIRGIGTLVNTVR